MFIDVLSTLRRVPGLDVDRRGHRATASPSRPPPASRVRVLPRHRAGGPVGGRADRDPPRARRGLRARRCSCPATRRCCEPGELAALIAGRARRRDRPRPARHRHERARARRHPTRSSRASARAASRATWRPPSAAGVPHRVEEVPGLALDVDTPDDLAELAAELELRRGQAPLDPRRAPPARPRGRARRACRRPRPDLVHRQRARPSPARPPGRRPRRADRRGRAGRPRGRRRPGRGPQGGVEGRGPRAPAERDRAGRARARARRASTARTRAWCRPCSTSRPSCCARWTARSSA